MDAQQEQLSQQSTVASAVFSSIFLISNAIWNLQWSWWLSWPVWLVAIPLRLSWIPLSYTLHILLTLLSPVVLPFIYAAKLLTILAAFVYSLEPLYTYFGTAATFGLVAGAIVAFASSTLSAQLGMYSYSPSTSALTRRSRKPWRITGDSSAYRQKAYFIQDPGFTHDETVSSSNEADWQWLDTSPTAKRPGGLLSQTIHEEDDSSGTDL